MTKIKKNDTVVNNIQLAFGTYPNFLVLPVGTQLMVHKTTRTGTLYCSAVDRNLSARMYNTISVRTTDVTKVNKPLPTATVTVNDIFVSSGGYDQTNVTFYKITKVTKLSAYVVEIATNRNYTGHMNGEATPNEYDVHNTHPNGKPKQVRITTHNNTPCFKALWGTATPWNGKPCFFSEWH